ncbi:solute carrier family 23 protein, partial [Citrobacter freundii]|uniref:solute carrier family 23 protein n=1 Tax=Citrobacter freundii TaxID=546 RepID=UPI0023EE65B3
QPFEMWMALIPVLCMGSIAVFTRGLLQRLLLLVGLILAYAIYAITTNGLGFGKPIDFSQISQVAWFGIPNFSHPTFDTKAMLIIA